MERRFKTTVDVTKSKEWRQKVQNVKVFYFHYYVCHLLFCCLCNPKCRHSFPLFSYVFAAFSLFVSGVEAVIGDESFNVDSSVSAEVLKVGQKVHQWLKEPNNFDKAEQFAKSVVCQLQSCIPASGRFKSVQSRRERMWGNYHQVRCSSACTSAWKSFLGLNLGTQGHPIFWQRVGDGILKTLVKRSFPVIRQEAGNECSPVCCWLCAKSSP